MKYLILAMLLTVVQAAPPIPRKTADQSTTGSQDVQSQSKANLKPATSPAALKPAVSAPEDKQEGCEPSKADKTRAVAIREPITVSVQKDCWDYLYIALTGLLVIVGGLTLGAIWYQANQTAVATRAVQRNTDAFIESQRPILATYPHGNPFADLMDTKSPRVRLSLVNKGQTTAHECDYESWIEMLPVPHPIMDFTAAADHAVVAERFSLPPDHKPIVINIPFTKGLTDGDRADLGNMRRTAYVRLRVTFRDAFSPDRYAEFGYWIMFEGLGVLPKYQHSD